MTTTIVLQQQHQKQQIQLKQQQHLLFCRGTQTYVGYVGCPIHLLEYNSLH